MRHEFRLRVLKQIVDEASVKLMRGALTIPEADQLLERVRDQARLLLPNDLEKFDLIYATRLRRLADQFVRQAASYR